MIKPLIEASPVWIPVCALTATVYTLLLYYRLKVPWKRSLHFVMAGLRWMLVFMLTLLLLNFLVRHIDNRYEEPVFAILLDNSSSMSMMLDTPARQSLYRELKMLREALKEKHFEVPLLGLRGTELETVEFTETVTNLSEALRLVAGRYEGRQLDGVLVITDGIYNAGLSPPDVDFPVPVYSVGVGDTVQKPDLAIQDVWYNKIAYQGSRFPVRAEITAHGFKGMPVSISFLHKGRVVQQQHKTVPPSGFLTVEFVTDAAEEGMQRWDIAVEVKPGESNQLNNRATLFVDVIKGRRKILILAVAPHPDIGTLRSILEKNSNYEALLHIPGVYELPPDKLKAENIDLIIFFQLPDQRGRLGELTQQFLQSPLPRFFFS